jgi:hypothetical protein
MDDRTHIADGVSRVHIALATELLTGLRFACLDGSGPPSLDDMWSRARASVDALRRDRAASSEVAVAAAATDPDATSIAVLLLAETGAPDSTARIVGYLRDPACEPRDAAWWGLRLANIGAIADDLSALAAQPTHDYATATARDALAAHRRPVDVPMPSAFESLPEDVAWLTAHARGRAGGEWDGALLSRFLAHPSGVVKATALQAAARARFRDMLDFCRSSSDAECLEFLGVVGDANDLARLEQAATGGDAELARAAIAGLGKLGLIAAVRPLLDLLDDAERARPAASAIARITGERVRRDASDAIDAAATREWWSSHATNLDSAKRYQAGCDVTEDPLGAVFDELPHRLRRDVYLRERALAPNAPDWELETWPWRQRTPAG